MYAQVPSWGWSCPLSSLSISSGANFPRPCWRLLGKLVGSGCVVAVCGTARSHCHASLRLSALAISVYSWCFLCSYFCLYAVPPAFVRRIGHAVVVGVVCMRSVSLCLPMGACSQSDKGLQSPQTHFWGSPYSLHRHKMRRPVIGWYICAFSQGVALQALRGEGSCVGMIR